MPQDVRVIEDYLPIEAISAEASREKSIRKGTYPPCISGGRVGRWWPAARRSMARSSPHPGSCPMAGQMRRRSPLGAPTPRSL